MDRTTSTTHEEAFAGSNNFSDSQQYASYDNLNFFTNTADPAFNDAGWGLNASEYPVASRAQQPTHGYPHHLSAQITHQGYSGQALPYNQTQSHSPSPYATNGFANYQSPSPYPYQNQKYDPTLVQPSANPQQPQAFNNHIQYKTQTTTTATTTSSGSVAHQTLPQSRPQQTSLNVSNVYQPSQYQQSSQAPVRQSPAVSASNPTPDSAPTVAPAQTQTQAQASAPNAIRHADEEALASAIPNSADAGIFRIVSFDELAKASNSQRLAPYVNIGNDRLEWNCNRSALPSYTPRHSRKELKELASKNISALAKIGKKQPKEKSLSSPLKVAKSVKPSAVQSHTPQNAKADIELSSEEEDSSSDDDDSEYSDDDEEESPLPSKKPEDLKGSIEYDTIKALWRSKRKEISAESFRGALVDFWEIVKTIRDRWKTDSTALSEAEEKKRTGELPLLRSRVKDQRDLIEVVFRTALKHGHRGVVELLAENQSLVFVCFQFLLDRHKAEDLNGPVTRAILETMSTFTTLTEEKLEKTRLNKLFPLYLKKGDAKTQFWVKKIKQNAATATKNASAKDGGPKKPAESAGKTTTTETIEKAASPPTKQAEPVAGVKRAAASSVDANPAKKAAMGASKAAGPGTTTTTKVSSVVKKPLTGATATAAGVNAAAQRKTVPAKPSGFFSSLQSAAKKPGTSIADKPSAGIADRTNGVRPAPGTGAPPPKPAFSFAETMAKLSMPKEEKPAPKPEKEVPNETPEARAKRLRKEERRKLHVRFKSDAELVQIRLFTHDPEEETHHDASQVRDVSDVGGEGRMFKQQHQMMDLDDEDEVPEEDGTLVAFSEPSLVDFSVVDVDERRRNYAPYGGGDLTPQSPERAERERYENGTLMAVYATPADIPSDPREPANPYSGDLNTTPQSFGAPEDKYIARARAKRARMNPQVPAPPSGFDFGALANFMNRSQQHATPPPMAAPPVAVPSAPDIEKILATLRQGGIGATHPNNAPAPQPPAPSMPYGNFLPAAQPPNPLPPSAPTVANPVAGLDLGAILAALQKNPIPGNTTAPQGPTSNAHANNDDDDLEEVKARHPFYKTKACRFWQEGRCQKGASCSYLHE